MGRRRRVSLEDAARAMRRGQTFVGLEERAAKERPKPSLPRLKFQEMDPSKFEEEFARRRSGGGEKL